MIKEIDFIFYTLRALNIPFENKIKFEEKNLIEFELLQFLKKEDINIDEKINQILYSKDKKYLNYFLEKFSFIYNENSDKHYKIKKYYIHSIAIAILYSIKEYLFYKEDRFLYKYKVLIELIQNKNNNLKEASFDLEKIIYLW